MLGSRVLLRTATAAARRCLPRQPAVAGTAWTQMKMYSKQANDAKDHKQQSILTEDLLAKAGFEDPQEGEKGPKEEGEAGSGERRRKRRAQTSQDKQREKYANWFYLGSFGGLIGGVAYMARSWDSEDEQKRLEGQGIANDFTPGASFERMHKRWLSLFTFFSEPVFENLLPPPAPEAYRRPLTLVLTLDDLLIHSSWDTKNGWRTAKRPGLDYFLGYLSQYYEIVIFGSNYQMYSDQTVAKLDPYHAYVSYALFREACRYKDGKLIKDLSLLNRDLGKTVVIDIDEDSYSFNPENAIPVPAWDGKADDYLIQMIPFLEYLATQPVKDVRPILSSFEDKHNIIAEFKVREAKLRAKWTEENKHLLGNRPNAGNFLAGLLGMPASSLNKGPKMPLDIIREHGQLQYEHFQKYLQENAPKFAEEERKLKEEFGKSTLNKLMTEGAPSAESIAKAQADKAKEQ